MMKGEMKKTMKKRATPTHKSRDNVVHGRPVMEHGKTSNACKKEQKGERERKIRIEWMNKGM